MNYDRNLKKVAILNFDKSFKKNIIFSYFSPLNAIYLLSKVIIPKQLTYVHVLSLYLQKERQYSFFFQHNLPIKICTVNPY